MSTDTRTVEQAIEDLRIAMVVTPDLRARPMTVASVDGDRLAFMTDNRAAWVKQLADGSPVGVTFSDGGDGDYVSLTGHASTSQDRELLDRLWNVAANAWFDGADDPNLVALLVEVQDGEYWDSADNVVSRAIRGAAAVATGSGSELLGSKGDVAT